MSTLRSFGSMWTAEEEDEEEDKEVEEEEEEGREAGYTRTW